MPPTNEIVIFGYGYLGTHLAQHFARLGLSVTVFTKRKIVSETQYHISFKKYSSVSDALKYNWRGVKFVFYASGRVDHSGFTVLSSSFFHEHFLGMTQLVDSGRLDHIEGFIYLGSSDEYGVSTNRMAFSEDALANPRTSYALAKQLSTQYLLQKSRSSNFPCIVLRPFLIYGPDQYPNRFVGRMLASFQNGVKFEIQNPMFYRDFLFLGDFLDFCSLLVGDFKLGSGKVFNVSSNQPVPLKDVGQLFNTLAKADTSVWSDETNSENQNYLFGSNERAFLHYGWKPATSLEHGLELCLEPRA